MNTQTTGGRIKLKQISADAFITSADQAALDNLQKVPVLPLVVEKFNEYALDHAFYVQNTAGLVKCGPDQFRTLYRLLREGCKILDVPEPELYLMNSPRFMAFTAGIKRTFVVVSSGLVNQLTDDEILFVLGHELGHIKCKHLLYRTVGQILMPLLEILGKMTLGLSQVATLGLVTAFYEWMRQSEFSCDRAGLLTCQDPTVALTATMKIGCGGSRFDSEMSLEALLEQARTRSEGDNSSKLAKALLFLMYNWRLSHPQVVFRAKHIDEWVTEGAYQKILDGDYPREAQEE